MSSDSRKPSRDVWTNGADELLARRERGAVDEEVEAAELPIDRLEDLRDLRIVGDVERQDQRICQATPRDRARSLRAAPPDR